MMGSAQLLIDVRLEALYEDEFALNLQLSDLIAMALGNLIDNATSYGPDSAPVEVSLEPFGEGWRIAVDDLGSSLPAAEARRIFEPYVRGATATGKPGDGLGLFVVRKVAEAHQGTAGVERSPAGGNRFWFEIGRL